MPDKDKRPLRATIRGFHGWAFERVRLGQGGPDGEDFDAFNYIMTRWLELDRDCADRDFGINRDAWKVACGLNVSDIEVRRAKRDKRTAE